MKLRAVTIWTTGVMLIAAVSPVLFFLATGRDFFDDVDATVLLILAGSTLFVSFIVSLNLKYEFPAAILLVSTTVYCVVYVLVLLQTIFIETEAFLLLFLIGIAWFPVMIPVWIITLVLEFAKRQENR